MGDTLRTATTGAGSIILDGPYCSAAEAKCASMDTLEPGRERITFEATADNVRVLLGVVATMVLRMERKGGAA